MDFYIWRDRFGEDAFVIGVLRKNGRRTCWAFVYGDGLSEMFGDDVYQGARDLEQDRVLHVVVASGHVSVEVMTQPLPPKPGGPKEPKIKGPR